MRSERPLAAAALAVLLLMGTAKPALTVRPIKIPAPEFPPGLAWINSVAFNLERLRGNRVVMVTFINTMTAASVRTFPHLNRLWDRYNQKGLMIIGVHTPDYDFDRDPLSIKDVIERNKIRFPVVIDGSRQIWKSYRNEGWPAHYLIDHKGRIIHDRLGEGGFAEFEDEILQALRKLRRYRPAKNYVIPPDPVRKGCGKATAGFYLGSRRGSELKKIRADRSRALVDVRDGEIAAAGRWSTELDAVRSKEDAETPTDDLRLRLIYHGTECLTVLTRTSREPARVYLKQNNLWLHSGNGGKDVVWDDDDRSYILVDKPRLYNITRNKKEELFELSFYPARAGVGFASFEFSDQCQTEAAKPR
ncbi:MAG: redoxin domain-containing protein [Elusimicrobiota bacterium]